MKISLFNNKISQWLLSGVALGVLGCVGTHNTQTAIHASANKNVRDTLVMPSNKSISPNNSSQKNQIQNTSHKHRHHQHKRAKLFHEAKKKLNDKYSYGAQGPHTFDCSGFTKYIFQRSLHVSLPRTTHDQYQAFHQVNNHHRKSGDLVFFGSSKQNIYHVGLYLGHGKMIDAQNRGVVIEHVHAPWWHEVGYSRPVNF